MATSFTFDTLVAQIQGHCEDHDEEFETQIETIIQLGEDRLLKDLPLTIFDGRDNVALVAGDQASDKPAGCIVTHEISYLSGGSTLFLYPRSYSFLRAAVPNTTQAAPRWFADDYAEGEYWIAPNPNLTVTAEALMTKRPVSLVTDTSGTWLSANLGDLLLDACMIAAEKFNIGMDEAKVWASDYTKKLEAARREYERLLRRPYMGG